MARATRGRGPRGRGNSAPRSQDMGTSEKRMGRRPMDKTVKEAARAYKKGTNEGIRKIIEKMEERIMEEDSEEETEEWRDLIPDSGNTRGRLFQFKQTLHLYWPMKRLVGKATEKVSMGMDLIIRDMLDYKRDLQTI